MPISLGRSIIHRYLWSELNTRYHGSSYLFVTNDDDAGGGAAGGGGELEDGEDVVALEKELTSKLETLIRQKLNLETRQAEYILVIKQDIENEKVNLPIYDFELEEKKIEQYESIMNSSSKKKMKKDSIDDIDGDNMEKDDEEDKDDGEDKFKNVTEQTLIQKAELAIYYEELNRASEEKEAEEKFKKEQSMRENE